MKTLYPSSIHTIVIRTPNWVGDAVMSTPFIRAVRRNFPYADITLLAKPWVAPVYEQNPHIDHIMIYDAAGRHRGLRGKLRLAKDLRKRKFDLAILLQNAFEAAMLAWLAGIPDRLGYDTDARRMLLTHPVHRYHFLKQIHQIEYYLEILRRSRLMTDGSQLEIFFTPAEIQTAEKALYASGCHEYDRIIGINPGAAFGTAKRWFADRYAQVCINLKIYKKTHFIIFGSPGETALGEQIRQMVGNDCTNLCGKTSLREAMARIGRCSLFITNDSGLMHIAAALHVPQIAIFGATNPATTSPRSPLSHILRTSVECSPCMKQDCPTDHRCMESISVGRVSELAMHLLGSWRQS